MRFGMEIKRSFFDRKTVRRSMDRATHRALSKFGAFVRRRAKSSIRKRKRVSRPGSPPSSHVGTLRDLIFFGYDERRRSVVIGPTLFRAGSTVPVTLETGGFHPVVRRDGSTSRLLYRKRPFMKPAFDSELPNAAGLFRDQLRRGGR